MSRREEYDELEVKHRGETFFVSYRINTTKEIDDSFDGHEGGMRHTFHRSHFEVDDFDVLAVCDDEGDEINPDLVPGLSRLIDDIIKDTDLSE